MPDEVEPMDDGSDSNFYFDLITSWIISLAKEIVPDQLENILDENGNLDVNKLLILIEEKHIEDWISEETQALLNDLFIKSAELNFSEEASIVEGWYFERSEHFI